MLKFGVKELNSQRHTFIYGGGNSGHYLNNNWEDLIKLTNQMSKVNPKFSSVYLNAKYKIAGFLTIKK